MAKVECGALVTVQCPEMVCKLIAGHDGSHFDGVNTYIHDMRRAAIPPNNLTGPRVYAASPSALEEAIAKAAPALFPATHVALGNLLCVLDGFATKFKLLDGDAEVVRLAKDVWERGRVSAKRTAGKEKI